MKINTKRTIYLILIAVILFSASMAIPELYNSKWRDYMQGGALGLMVVGIINIARILLSYNQKSK